MWPSPWLPTYMVPMTGSAWGVIVKMLGCIESHGFKLEMMGRQSHQSWRTPLGACLLKWEKAWMAWSMRPDSPLDMEQSYGPHAMQLVQIRQQVLSPMDITSSCNTCYPWHCDHTPLVDNIENCEKWCITYHQYSGTLLYVSLLFVVLRTFKYALDISW